MKAIRCEMCESTDFLKNDGIYICQGCGAKYSVDEAKKLMVDLEEDNAKISNLYERARQSLEVDDLKNAAEYYKQILDENPKDWEAYFYSYLGETTTFTNNEAATVAKKLGNTIPPAYDMAIADCDGATATKRVQTISEKTSDRLTGIAATAATLLRKYEGGSRMSAAGSVNCNMYQNLRPVAVNTVAHCVLAFAPLEEKLQKILSANNNLDKESVKKSLLYIRRARYQIADMVFYPVSGTPERLIKPELIKEYAEKIHELDPSFSIPSVESKTNTSGGCYVATAVYGTYDCPQVWTLRRYRDNTLANTWYGRAFIHTYYAISPTIVKFFGNTQVFQRFWKKKLDKWVRNLNDNGFENTPYQDKKW